MTAAVRNYVAVPFFDRVPPRVMELVITTFDNIVERALSKRDAYHFFANGVKQRHLEGPTFEEFADWHERVKNGLVDRPHPSDTIMPRTAFFDSVPTRVKDKVLTAFDNITQRSHQSPKEAYNYLINTLRHDNVEGPTFDEYVSWRLRVTNGLIERPDQNHVRVAALEARARYEESAAREPHTIACVVDLETVDTERLRHARAVVAAAHALNEAKLAAGYSPASITLDDTVLQQALTDLLSAEAEATLMDADVHMTAGNKLVDLLLGEGDTNIDEKLVACLTMDMQPELCRLLVRSDADKSR